MEILLKLFKTAYSKFRRMRNKNRRQLIKFAKDYMPYDYAYMLDVLKSMADWNAKYYDTSRLCVGDEYTAKEMRLISSLCDILINQHIYIDYEKNNNKKLVNLNNYKRFLPNAKIEFLEKFPDVLYFEKAQHLLGLIISKKLMTWWN